MLFVIISFQENVFHRFEKMFFEKFSFREIFFDHLSFGENIFR